MPPERAGEQSDDSATVGAVNVLWSLDDNLNVVGSVGTAFRSPNTVERFFEGFTPGGSAIQVINPNLRPERSVNVDLGFKYRRRSISLELPFFRNDIDDGIRIDCLETDDSGNCTKDADGFNWAFWRGFSTSLNYTYLTAENRETNRYTNDGPNTLFRNDGDDRFTDVTTEAGVGNAGFSVGSVFGDLDNDGDLDLYVVNFGTGPDALYRNDGPTGPGGA